MRRRVPKKTVSSSTLGASSQRTRSNRFNCSQTRLRLTLSPAPQSGTVPSSTRRKPYWEAASLRRPPSKTVTSLSPSIKSTPTRLSTRMKKCNCIGRVPSSMVALTSPTKTRLSSFSRGRTNSRTRTATTTSRLCAKTSSRSLRRASTDSVLTLS